MRVDLSNNDGQGANSLTKLKLGAGSTVVVAVLLRASIEACHMILFAQSWTSTMFHNAGDHADTDAAATELMRTIVIVEVVRCDECA